MNRRTAATLFAVVLVSVGLLSANAQAANLGVYRGAANPSGVRDFENWLGRSVTYAHDFLASDNWGTIESPDWWLSKWKSSPYTVVYSVPMLPRTGGSLQSGASGAYNSHFRKLAETLVAYGEGDAILRLGWEFNLSGWSWSAHGDPGAYAAYWRQIVTTMRSVSPAFKFDWSPNLGKPLPAAYPGDAYVDFIGLDVYDQWWSSSHKNDLQARWNWMLTQEWGLHWHRDFARAHGKPMTYPEWGLWIRSDGHGGGDNPYFIERMHEWIASNNVAYANYFEFDPGSSKHRLMASHFPNGAAKFRQLFANASAPPVESGGDSPVPTSEGTAEGSATTESTTSQSATSGKKKKNATKNTTKPNAGAATPVVLGSPIAWARQSFNSADSLRGYVQSTGRSWEFFLRTHQSVADSLGYSGVRWDGETFYTKAALRKRLLKMGIRFSKWAKRHPAAMAKLDKKASFRQHLILTQKPELRSRKAITVRGLTFTGSRVTVIVRDARGRILGLGRTRAKRGGELRTTVAIPRWKGQKRLVVTVTSRFDRDMRRVRTAIDL